MLHEFLTANREELIVRCRAKVEKRPAPRPTEPELRFGIPLFLDQLTRTLRVEESTRSEEAGATVAPDGELSRAAAPSEIGRSAADHGKELLRQGFTVDQVVHDYGDVCQAVTDLAVERKTPITAGEYRTLNQCLDNAIAGAVGEYGRQRDQAISDQGTAAANERLGGLAHEMRNLLNTAMLAVEAVKRGDVGIAGATGAVLDRSLIGLRNLLDRSLADVRLTAGIPERRELISVAEFMEEAQVPAVMEAKVRRVELTLAPVARGLWMNADRHMLSAALANLLQNAFKFTRPKSLITLSAIGSADRLLISVEDECGGLPPGTAEELFRPFTQHGHDRSGLGLGLSISRRSVEANGGRLHVRDLPGKGCVFTIDLPLQQPRAALG